MPMTSEQTNAFKAGSGSLDVNILHLLCIGALLAFLFFMGRVGAVGCLDRLE
jgi:hypothetical protein